MGYRDHLWRMLEPLGVYGGEGYSGGELAALGAEMDRLQEKEVFAYLPEHAA